MLLKQQCDRFKSRCDIKKDVLAVTSFISEGGQVESSNKGLVFEGGLLTQLMSKIADSNRTHMHSRGVNINHLTKDITTQQHSLDEQQISLFLSKSIAKDDTQGMDVSNEQTEDIEGYSNLKIDNGTFIADLESV